MDAISITLGVAAKSETEIEDSSLSISEIYAYTSPSAHVAPWTARASPSSFVVAFPPDSREISNVPFNWNDGTSICTSPTLPLKLLCLSALKTNSPTSGVESASIVTLLTVVLYWYVALTVSSEFPTVIVEPTGSTSTVEPSFFSTNTFPTGAFSRTPTPLTKVTHSAILNASLSPSKIVEPTLAAMYSSLHSAISIEGANFLPYLYLYNVLLPLPPVISWSSIETERDVLRAVVPVNANIPLWKNATSAVETKKFLEFFAII